MTENVWENNKQFSRKGNVKVYNLLSWSSLWSDSLWLCILCPCKLGWNSSLLTVHSPCQRATQILQEKCAEQTLVAFDNWKHGNKIIQIVSFISNCEYEIQESCKIQWKLIITNSNITKWWDIKKYFWVQIQLIYANSTSDIKNSIDIKK